MPVRGDAPVVGGGPAGPTVTVLLARAGLTSAPAALRDAFPTGAFLGQPRGRRVRLERVPPRVRRARWLRDRRQRPAESPRSW